MDTTEPKVCRACYMGVNGVGHCRGSIYCDCRCRELRNVPPAATATQWAEVHEREAPIREAMRRVERDYIERERRSKS